MNADKADHAKALAWCNKYRVIQGDSTLGNLAAAYLELDRDLTRLRAGCLALADEMERTGRQGDADRLREIVK